MDEGLSQAPSATYEMINPIPYFQGNRIGLSPIYSFISKNGDAEQLLPKSGYYFSFTNALSILQQTSDFERHFSDSSGNLLEKLEGNFFIKIEFSDFSTPRIVKESIFTQKIIEINTEFDKIS